MKLDDAPELPPTTRRPPWGATFAWTGTGVAVVLLAEVVQGTDRLAPRAAQLVVGAALTATVVALTAGLLTRRSPWWVLALAAWTTLAGPYLAAFVLPSGTDYGRAEALPPASHHSLMRPDVAGEWHRVDTARSQARERAALARYDDASLGLLQTEEPIYGEYQRGADENLMFIGVNAMDAGRAILERSPRSTVRSAFAGSGIEGHSPVDPGSLGGAMACTQERLPPDNVVCIWADASTVGLLRVAAPDLDVPAAAGLAREFREGATQES